MRGIEQQFLALQKGLTEVVPGTLLKPFDEREIELIISGIGTIDIEDWKRNTRLKVIINTKKSLVNYNKLCSYKNYICTALFIGFTCCEMVLGNY